jgi:pilus assembly protein CpaF
MTVTFSDTHGELIEQLDARVREVVRREGVDPQRDNGAVRRIAEAVVEAHDQHSLTGAVVPVPDPRGVVNELVARVAGFGALQPFLDDPSVEEVWINDPSRVFVARSGRHELTNLVLTQAQVNELVERMLKSSGRRIDISQPFVDAMLPEGHRLHVVLEGISRGFTAVNIRKFVLKAARLQDLVELGSLTAQAAAFLEASIRAGLNVLVAGGTQAGKTTMLNCLAAAIPGGDRVISCEEVFELPNTDIVHTCEQLSIPDNPWTRPAKDSPSRASLRTARSWPSYAVGPSSAATTTTTHLRPGRRSARASRPCSPRSRRTGLPSSSRGRWTG